MVHKRDQRKRAQLEKLGFDNVEMRRRREPGVRIHLQYNEIQNGDERTRQQIQSATL